VVVRLRKNRRLEDGDRRGVGDAGEEDNEEREEERFKAPHR
jgi:hypothetical protein